MRAHFLLISLLATSPAFSADFGVTTNTSSNGTPVAKPPAATPPKLPPGPQVTGLFRIVKPDGATVIQQTPISVGSSTINVINVSTADAFLASNGKCAFNVKYDEISATAAKSTTNRLFSNDVLIAQNTNIELAADVLKTIWTQPYLVPGQNNIKFVINADSATPSVGWVRVNVAGTCTLATTPPVVAKPPVDTKPVVTPPAPPPPPVVRFSPGSVEWNNLYIAFGYSNFGTTQLKGKPFARYADLVKLNADITAVINAKVIEQAAYNSLMARWNTFVNDAAFKAAMTAATAAASQQSGKK